MPFFRVSDVDRILAGPGGIDVTFGATTVKGFLDISDESVEQGAAADFLGQVMLVTVRTGALPGIQEGSILTADGINCRVMRVQRVDDGAITRIQCAQSDAAPEEPVEEGLDEAQVREVVETMMGEQGFGGSKFSPRFYSFDSADGMTSIGSVGSTTSMETPACILESGTPGANKFRLLLVEHNERDIVHGGPNNEQWQSFGYHFACMVGPAETGGGGTGFCGIAIGHPYEDTTPDTSPPWLSPSATPYARLGVNIATGMWELQVSVGDGTTPVSIYSFQSPVPWFQGSSHWCELHMDPFNRRLTAKIDGEDMMVVDTVALLPKFGASDTVLFSFGIMANCFIESGPSASSVVQCFFSGARCWADSYYEGAEVWYG